MERKLDIPSGLDHIKMVAVVGEKNRHLSTVKLEDFKSDLEIVGISLSILFQASTCHRKCFGGSHILESLAGRSYNLACSAYILICRGFYDEALNLMRSMGEIYNLIALLEVDNKAFQNWLNSDAKTRIHNFGPGKIRELLKGQADFLYADKDWYSKFCEDYTHVHPGTRPNTHNEQGQAHAGGVFQEEGLKFAIDELANLCALIALIISKHADLDDLFEELCGSISSYVKKS